MIVVELVDGYQGIDIAPEHDAQGERPQGSDSLADGCIAFGTKQAGDELGDYPHNETGHGHGDGDEVERLAQHQTESLVVATPHLDGAEGLDGAGYSCQEEIVYLQQIHAHSQSEEAHATAHGCYAVVGGEEQQSQAPYSYSQGRALGDNLAKRREKREVADGLTVAALIKQEQVETPQYVTVSVNEEFIDADSFDTHVLKEGDEVEFLYFMGGGAG